MKENTEYQIYIGCQDSRFKSELVGADELKELVVKFFKKKEIGFSMYIAKGGYLHSDGTFITEDSLCINLIGTSDLDIKKLARSLSMFMNQECTLVVKDIIRSQYR